MFKRLFKSQDGFSIVQALLTAAAVAGMAYVGTKLTTDQKMAQKGLESRTKVEQLHAMIYSILQNKDHCTQTFLSNGVAPAPNTTASVPRIFTAGSAMPVFVYRSWYHATRDTVYMQNSVVINSMAVEFKNDFTQHADLRIEYSKLEDSNMRVRSGKGFGAKDSAKTIKLKIQTNPTDGTFESCYAIDESQNADMIKNFCEGLGADNDPSTANLFEWSDTNQKCVLKDIKCPSGEVYTGFDSNGIRKCYTIQNWMNFGDLIDQTSLSTCNATTSTSVSFVIVGGKAKIQCNGSATNVNCDGSWNACNSSGIQTFTITTAPQGTGTPCPASPRTCMVEDCGSYETLPAWNTCSGNPPVSNGSYYDVSPSCECFDRTSLNCDFCIVDSLCRAVTEVQGCRAK